ncbi:VOC family protein [Leucobacter viscericola]|uniref:VOC family protein n=1 Tax=Leucobacter viscericola TaxID=2714935 RepID=A0A6G7XDE3_9MICO|nr:VOC family protein [Leucobacter viscericola]QIK62391.1 VOC family protein [Leucobacter viscericola]
MQKIVTNIWCNGNAEEVGAYYADLFPNARTWVESRYPLEGLLEFQQPLAGEPLTVGVEIGEARLTLINADDTFSPNPSVSLMLNFDPLDFDGDAVAARAQLDTIWEVFAEDGSVLMPLQEYPFSARYGWVQDRYGVSWQFMLTDPAGESRPFVVPALMFGGPAQNRATAAVDRYLEVFEDAELGQRVLYGEATGPAEATSVMFSDFRIGEQWFTAMDSGREQDFSFTCGMSFEAHCEDQAEIDRLWDALSTVPAAEQCGWLVDPFGMNWQIVPKNMGELMERPNAFQHLMPMKKIIIADI